MATEGRWSWIAEERSGMSNSDGTCVRSGVTGGRSPGAYAPSLTAISPTGSTQGTEGSMSMRRLSLGGKGVCSTSKLFENGFV